MTDSSAPPDFEDARREFDRFPLHKALGVTLVESRPGFARIVLHTSSVTLGGVGGSVHGGLSAALIDIATLEALKASREPGDVFNGTADLNITYLRPALGANIYAVANVIRKGRSMSVLEVEILDEEGGLCAKGRTIYALRRGT